MIASIYARVSTDDQNCRLQLAELREYAARRGWSIAGEYVDAGWSGAKASRPELDRLMAAARRRKIDAVLCWKLDRFGRSVVNCLNLIQELRSAGVRLICTTQGIDSDESNPAAQFMLTVLAAAAEFERALIRERSAAGLKRYREEHAAGRARSRSGKNLAVGRPRVAVDRERILELRADGVSFARIAKLTGLGVGTVVRAATETTG